MAAYEESAPSVVALLLDDACRPNASVRCCAPRASSGGLKRKRGRGRGGTTPGELRRYEHGDDAGPADVCAELAECYGDDLTAHVPLRVPPQSTARHHRGRRGRRALDATDADDVIAGYIDIVRRLRSSEPGDPLALRTVDIVALSGALGRDRDDVEQRIAEVLGCSPHEARSLHGELLRRKVILPVAGLVAGMAVVAGVGVGVAYASAIAPAPAAAKIEAQAIAHVSAPPTTAARRATPRRRARDDDADHRGARARPGTGSPRAEASRHRRQSRSPSRRRR